MDEGEDRERDREDQPAKHAGINFHNKRQDYDINIPRETTGIGHTVSEPTRLTIHYCSGVSRCRTAIKAAEKSRTAVSTRPRQSADCVTHSLAPNRKHLHNLQQ